MAGTITYRGGGHRSSVRSSPAGSGGPRASACALALLLTVGCVSLGTGALRDEISVAQPPAIVAAICGSIARQAFPAADSHPYFPGVLVRTRGAERYVVELAEGADGEVRVAGNLRLAIRSDQPTALVDALQPTLWQRPEEDTDLPFGRRGLIHVSIEPAAQGSRVEIIQRGSLRTSPLAAHLSITLRTASAIAGCVDALQAGAAQLALERAMQGLAAASTEGVACEPRWLARVHIAAALAQQELQTPANAVRSLEAALDLAPDFTCARYALAKLTHEVAQPRAANAQVRTLAMLPALGFSSVGHQRRRTLAPDQDQETSATAVWLSVAKERMQAGDLASAERYAQVARTGRSTPQAPALALLAEIADRRDDHRLAIELRLSQAQAGDFTADLVLRMSHSLASGGDAQRASRWLEHAWPDVASDAASDAAAHALLEVLVARLSTESSRLLPGNSAFASIFPALPSMAASAAAAALSSPAAMPSR